MRARGARWTLPRPGRPMSCWLTSGFFSLVALQGLLLAASLGSIAVKFVRDPAGRVENEFLLDASRQIVGTFWAALVADPVRGLFTGLVVHGGDECAWYLVELVADATIGVWLAYRALRLYLWGLRRYLGPQGVARVRSLCRPEYFDEEGKPLGDIYGVYAEQLVLWLVALTTAKLVLTFFMMFEAVQVHAILRATLLPLFGWSGHQEACLVATRVIMQSVQYWLVDSLFVAVHGLVPDDPAQRRLPRPPRSRSRLSLMAGSIRGSLSLSLSGPLLAEDDEEAALAAKERLATLQSEAREAQEHLQRALEERARGAQEIEVMREQARAKKAQLERMSVEYQEEERKTKLRAEERARLAAAKSSARPESEQQQAKKKGCFCGGKQPEVTPRLEPIESPALRLEPVAPAPARALPWSAELPEPFAYASATGTEAPVELPGFAELRAACGLVEAEFQASMKELLCQAASSGAGAATSERMAAARLAEDEAKTFLSIRDAYMVHVRLPANSTGSRFGSFLPRYYGMYIHQNERTTYVIKANPLAGCRGDIVEQLSITGHQGSEVLPRSGILELVQKDRKLVPVDEAARDDILAQLERDTAFLGRQPRPKGGGVPGGLTGYALTLGVVPLDTVRSSRALDVHDETRDGCETGDTHRDSGEAEGQEAVPPQAEPDDDAAGLVLTEHSQEKVLLLGNLEPIRFDSAAGSVGCDPDEPQRYRTSFLSTVRSVLVTGSWLEELPELYGDWGEVPPQLVDALPEPQREEAHHARHMVHEEEAALLAATEDELGTTDEV